MRISNNEEQISSLNGLVNKEADKIPILLENLYNVSLKKENRGLEANISEKVNFKESQEPKIPQFFRAPNN